MFGQVTSGLEFFDSISRRGRDTNDYPLEKVTIRMIELRGDTSGHDEKITRRDLAKAAGFPYRSVLPRFPAVGAARSVRRRRFLRTGRYRSGQTGRTVNPLAYAFAGSNPALPNSLFVRQFPIVKAIVNEVLLAYPQVIPTRTCTNLRANTDIIGSFLAVSRLRCWSCCYATGRMNYFSGSADVLELRLGVTARSANKLAKSMVVRSGWPPKTAAQS